MIVWVHPTVADAWARKFGSRTETPFIPSGAPVCESEFVDPQHIMFTDMTPEEKKIIDKVKEGMEKST